MGTDNYYGYNEEKSGILTRSIKSIYNFKENKKNEWDIKTKLSYMEI